MREWVSYHRLLKSFFELLLGSWYFFFWSKKHKNLQSFPCCSTCFCEEHVSAMTISPISFNGLSCWKSKLFTTSASYSVVVFLFGENTSIRDSQNPSSAAVFWYAKQSWTLFTLKTNLNFHTQISHRPIARFLSTSLLVAAFLTVTDDTDEWTSILLLALASSLPKNDSNCW